MSYTSCLRCTSLTHIHQDHVGSTSCRVSIPAPPEYYVDTPYQSQTAQHIHHPPHHNQLPPPPTRIPADALHAPLPVPRIAIPGASSSSSSLASWADLSLVQQPPNAQGQGLNAPQMGVQGDVEQHQHQPLPPASWPNPSSGDATTSLNSPDRSVAGAFDYQHQHQRHAHPSSPIEHHSYNHAPRQSYQQQSVGRSSTLPELTIDTRLPPSSGLPPSAHPPSTANSITRHLTEAQITTAPRYTHHQRDPAGNYRSSSSSASSATFRNTFSSTSTGPRTIIEPDITYFPTHEARMQQRQQARRRAAAGAPASGSGNGNGNGAEPYPTDRQERDGHRAARRMSHAPTSSASGSSSSTSIQQPTLPATSPQRDATTSLPPPPPLSAPAHSTYYGNAAGPVGGSVAVTAGGGGFEGGIPRFSDPPVMNKPCGTNSKGKAVDRSEAAAAAAEAAAAALDKKPFLACEFCRHRKVSLSLLSPLPFPPFRHWYQGRDC